MKIENICEVIQKIENQFSTEKWEIDGLRIWPFLRIKNYSFLSFKVANSQLPKTRSIGYFKKIINSRCKKSNFFRGVPNRLKKADIVFLSSGVSFLKLGDVFYDKLCDPIIDFYKEQNLSTEKFDLDYLMPFPTHNSTHYIQPAIDNIIIKSILSAKFWTPNLKNKVWADYDEFCKDEFVKSHLAIIPDKSEILIAVARIKALKKFFLRKLKIISPRLAFVVCYYSEVSMAFILACRELGIKTVDVQHGVQGDLHLGYSRWNLKCEQRIDALPDYFWVWSENEKKSIDLWAQNSISHQVIVGGNLFADMWKNENSFDVSNLGEDAIELKKFPNLPTILLTLSPFTENLMEDTWEVVRKSQEKYNWLIRLHPAMIIDFESIKKSIIQKGILHFEMDKTSSLPLPFILQNVDLHITCQSSCVIDSAGMGVFSIITSSYGESLYTNEINNQDAIVLYYTMDILNEIDKRVYLQQKPQFIDKGNNYQKKLMDLISK